MALLQVKNLKKIYTTRFGENKVQALSNVNFDVEEGEYVAIMGESGSGKTTLLNILAALDSPTSGEVLLKGNNIVKLKEKEISSFRREHLGFVFQDFNLLDTLSIGENIAMSLVINRENPEVVDKKVSDIAKKLGIENILEKFPYEVSGGQKQRAACARALINKPKLILADEPTGALDSKSSRMLLETMEEMNEKLNATIMMVTHDAFSASFCERILFLKDGKIFNEIYKGDKTRKEFFNEILDVLTLLGGDLSDVK